MTPTRGRPAATARAAAMRLRRCATSRPGRRLAEHGVPGPQRRRRRGSHRRGDARTRQHVLPASSATGPTPWPAAFVARDHAPRRGRPRHHRPVLRRGDRGARRSRRGARLQRRARPRPWTRGRGDRADDGPRDAPLRRDRPPRRHAGPARLLADLATRSSRWSRCGRVEPARRSRPWTSTTGRASDRCSSTSSSSATHGSRS